MADLNVEPGAPDLGAGGTGEPDPTPPKQVSYESYQKLLDEKKRFQAKADAADAAEEARKQKDLESKGKYQEVIAQRDADLKKAQDELAAVRRNEADRLKLSHLLDAIDGTVDPKFFKYIDHIDDIVIDPTTGEIDKMSVAKAAEKFKADYPEFIKSAKPSLPNGAPQGGPTGKISRSEWLKLSSSEMKKWKQGQITE